MANGGSPSTIGVLLVRLWKTDAAGQSGPQSDPMFWKSAAPAVSLILDLIAASGGAAGETHGNILTANFSGIQSALSAARRLQWAVQGLAEAETLRTTAVAVLVHSGEDEPGRKADRSLFSLLNKAAAGQILLTEKTCLHLRDLPGYALRAAAQSGLQELLWRGPEGDSACVSDEKALAQLIQRQGVAVNVEAAASEAPTVAAPGITMGAQGATRPAHADSANQDAETRPSPLRGKPLWLIGGVCAAVLLIVLIFVLSHKNPPVAATPAVAAPASNVVTAPKAEIPASPAAGSGGQPPATAPGQPANPADSAAKEQPPLSKAALRAAAKEAKKEAKEEAKREHEREQPPPRTVEDSGPPVITPKSSGGRCYLDQQEVPEELDTAERSLARGLYNDAERQFGAVLACEPGNGRARSGLDRVRKAQTER